MLPFVLYSSTKKSPRIHIYFMCINKVNGFVLYCHCGKFLIYFSNTSIYDRLIIVCILINILVNKWFFFNLILNPLQKLSGGGGMLFFP